MVLGIWFLVDARAECGGVLGWRGSPTRHLLFMGLLPRLREAARPSLLIFCHPQDPPRTSQQSGHGQCGLGPGILR